jgi:hypothetical protein
VGWKSLALFCVTISGKNIKILRTTIAKAKNRTREKITEAVKYRFGEIMRVNMIQFSWLVSDLSFEFVSSFNFTNCIELRQDIT